MKVETNEHDKFRDKTSIGVHKKSVARVLGLHTVERGNSNSSAGLF